MELLDQTYLNALVGRAGKGDSNAFAELYAATWERQYAYLQDMLQDAEAAEHALEETYIRVLRRLPALPKTGLFLPWISRIGYLVCREQQPQNGPEETAGAAARILQLPLTESQILLMTYLQGISDEEAAGILNFSRVLLRRYRKDGLRHLQKGMRQARDEADALQKELQVFGKTQRRSGGSGQRRPDAAAVTAILENIFAACGQEPNTIPMEALSSYAVYRRERFSLQRCALTAGLVVFLFLPLLFLVPKYEVGAVHEGTRGLPVYTIEIQSLLPVGRVTARMATHALPVYEAGAREYTVEPTRNGDMTIRVELCNRQAEEQKVAVADVDAEGPRLESSEIREDTLLLKVTDAGIGVDYREIYAVGASGSIYGALQTDEETGEVLFPYPEEDWDVYIPDHIGNTLHLALSLS